MRADETPVARGLRADRQGAPRVSPWAGPPGTEVRVEMSGLPAGTTLWIGAGALGAEQEILREVETDRDGALSTTVGVPTWAGRDRELFFFVSDTDSQPIAISAAFHVTDEDGLFRVEGRITGGGDCPVLRAGNDESYTLEGDVPEVDPGTRVVVEGRRARDPRCGGGRSIAVRRIEPR